jgi:hypothetical protein
MLYKLIDGRDCFELNPELLAIPEFGTLTDKQFRVVALVADRKSPLRTLPEKQRREKACLISGYGLEGNRPARNARAIISGEVDSIEKAIAKYREYQFDENQDTLDSTNKLIRTNREFIDHVNSRKEEEKKDKQYGKDLELANKFANQLPGLVESKQRLEALLQITTENKPEIVTYTAADLEEPLEEGGEGLNIIELWHKNNKKLE